ncbi:hypothetical protein ACIQSO_20795 [Pseudomonas putida]|uniref:hypothetical protein n=1 Tax=Pseudomonas putida TaxID=303 RepID=UPI00383A34BB
MWFTDLILAIPNVVWSGIVASVLTLTGVLLSNKSNTSRLKLQLKHDSEERQKERISSLRRETYLRVAEDMTKAIGQLGGLPQHDFSQSATPTAFNDLMGSSAKLQLIAEPATAAAVSKLAGAYTELHFKLLEKITPMQDLRIEMNINDNLYNDTIQEVKRISLEISRLIESSNATEQNMEALSNSLNFYSQQANEFSEKRDSAWEEFNKLHIAFSRSLYTEIQTVLCLQNQATFEIRKDLGLSEAGSEFNEQISTQSTNVDNALKKFIDHLEQKT